MIWLAVEQQATNSAAQVLGLVGVSGVDRQLSRLHGGKRRAAVAMDLRGAIGRAARSGATGGAPPQACPSSLIAIVTESAKISGKKISKAQRLPGRGWVRTEQRQPASRRGGAGVGLKGDHSRAASVGGGAA